MMHSDKLVGEKTCMKGIPDMCARRAHRLIYYILLPRTTPTLTFIVSERVGSLGFLSLGFLSQKREARGAKGSC